MEVGCDLEVDVNGEEIFIVDKKILSSFSGKFNKFIGRLKGSKGHLKVILHKFPGGADGFELLTRFCYTNGTFGITPSNMVMLHCAAMFMEMDSNSSAALNLVDQTGKCLEGINYWTWSELLVALKQCQDLLPAINSSFILQKILDCLIGRLALPTLSSLFTCSSNDSSFQSSCGTSSICSTRNNCSPTTWWFEDLLFLNVNLLDKVIRMMVSQKVYHGTIFKFLICYLKSRFLSATLAENCKITEVAINLLSLLDSSSLSCKSLFDILWVVSRFKKTSQHCILKLESLIGSRLDQASLDHLLVPSPQKKRCLYNVNLVLRLVKAFLFEGWTTPSQLAKVVCLIDSYLIEVAPDFLLKPSKFAALISLLPDCARECSDRLYEAIDMYLEVHTQLSEEEKMRLCCTLNYEKLSAESLTHLAQNPKFRLRKAVKVFISQKFKQNSLSHDHFHYLKTVSSIPFCRNTMEGMSGQEDAEQVLYVKKHEKSMETGYVEAKLQGMQPRVTELKQLCTMMQSRMSNVRKSRLCSPGKAKSLPKLCS